MNTAKINIDSIPAKRRTDFHKSRFPQIQALRGLAALLVVTQHIRFLGQGAFGVDIFFYDHAYYLSGYEGLLS